MKVRAIWWICLGMGLIGMLLPAILMEMATGTLVRGGGLERTLSVLVGPGMTIAGALFGIHSLAFVVLALTVNFVFWAGVTFAISIAWNRLRRNAH